MDQFLHLFEVLDPLIQPFLFTFALTTARVGGFILALPQLSNKSIPRQIKALVAIAIGAAIAWNRPLSPPPGQAAEFALFVGVCLELLLGLSAGFIVHVGMAAVRTAGQIIGIEMGLSFAAVADPLSQNSGTALSALLGSVAIQLFLIAGFDHLAILALAHSFDVRPFAGLFLTGSLPEAFAAMGNEMFRIAVRLALPVSGALFTLKLSMGLLARMTPRVQIFALTFTLTLLAGFILLGFILPSIGAAIARHLEEVISSVQEWSDSLSPPSTATSP